jgi:multidrug transporter EmrE-like cation transporter
MNEIEKEHPIKKELLLLILLIVTVEVASWYCLKKQYVDDKKVYLYLFFVLYAMIPFLLIRTLKYEGIGVTNMLWNIASTTLVLLIGYFIFKEHINHYQYFGIGFGILAIVLLTLDNK